MKLLLKKLGLTQVQAKKILNAHKKNEPVGDLVQSEMTVDKLKAEKTGLNKKYKFTVSELQKKEKEMAAFFELVNNNKTFVIRPLKSNVSEAVPVIVASDWHLDETIKAAAVSGKNSFNPEIAKARATFFFRNCVSLINIAKKDVKVNTVVLALLGDFISSSIHDELMEGNSMLPMEGILFAQELLMSGMNYILKHTNCKLIVPCCCGNHTRITQKVHISTEHGNSLEFLLYNSLFTKFKKNKRVEFVIAEGYHCYVNILGTIIRFHHGHAIRYAGGIGGIYIPVNKAIAQWDKMKKADLNVMGHFHQFRDGGNFICNGSLIGYSAFALRIKADFERPQQAFFLIDKKRGKTIVAPIILEKI